MNTWNNSVLADPELVFVQHQSDFCLSWEFALFCLSVPNGNAHNLHFNFHNINIQKTKYSQLGWNGSTQKLKSTLSLCTDALCFLFFLHSSFTLCYASVYILSASLYCSFMPHFSLSLHSPLCIFSLSTLYFVLLTLCPTSLSPSPQASCCSSSSTVITAVLSAVCSTTTILWM